MTTVEYKNARSSAYTITRQDSSGKRLHRPHARPGLIPFGAPPAVSSGRCPARQPEESGGGHGKVSILSAPWGDALPRTGRSRGQIRKFKRISSALEGALRAYVASAEDSGAKAGNIALRVGAGRHGRFLPEREALARELSYLKSLAYPDRLLRVLAQLQDVLPARSCYHDLKCEIALSMLSVDTVDIPPEISTKLAGRIAESIAQLSEAGGACDIRNFHGGQGGRILNVLLSSMRGTLQKENLRSLLQRRLDAIRGEDSGARRKAEKWLERIGYGVNEVSCIISYSLSEF